MAAPCVLIWSCVENYQPVSLIKEILSTDELPESQTVVEEIEGYLWNLDTKYYTADVLLCSTQSKTIGDEQFAESVEGIILYFNSDQKESFESVKSWLSFVKLLDPDVRLLLCQQCTSDSVVSLKTVQEWCIENNFELVETSPDIDNDDEVEDDFQDSYGVKRIVQSLQAHTWPNLVMKDHPSIKSEYFKQLMREQAEESANPNETSSKPDIPSDSTTPTCTTETVPTAAFCTSEEKTSDTIDKVNSDITDLSLESTKPDSNKSKSVTSVEDIPEENTTDSSKTKDGETNSQSKETDLTTSSSKENSDLLTSSHTAENPFLGGLEMAGLDAMLGGDETFERLFGNLRDMKEKAERLPAEERRKYAEKVAMSFLQAMGGDEDDLDLSDCSSD